MSLRLCDAEDGSSACTSRTRAIETRVATSVPRRYDARSEVRRRSVCSATTSRYRWKRHGDSSPATAVLLHVHGCTTTAIVRRRYCDSKTAMLPQQRNIASDTIFAQIRWLRMAERDPLGEESAISIPQPSARLNSNTTQPRVTLAAASTGDLPRSRGRPRKLSGRCARDDILGSYARAII